MSDVETTYLVTDLKKLDEKRFCLYVDYEPFGPVYLSDVRRLKLKVGAEIRKEELLRFKAEQFCKRAINKAVSMLQYSEKCEYDIRKKLESLSYDEEVIEQTIKWLKEYGYLDDARYASVYIRSHVSKKSRRELINHLSMKKISDDMIQTAFEECNLPSEEDVIRRVLSQKYTPDELREKKERAIAYFVRKGYPFRQVITCIDEMLSQ